MTSLKRCRGQCPRPTRVCAAPSNRPAHPAWWPSCNDHGAAPMTTGDKHMRVVCYVNQFFGQVGGEERAGVGPDVVSGAVGAARAVQQALGDDGTVVATVRCGDNYVAEQAEAAIAELVSLVAGQQPDLLIAGPAFQAGRYGVACGALCAAVQAQL